MKIAVRRALQVIAVAVALAPFLFAALVLRAGSTSLAIVAPMGLWLLVAFYAVPIILGFVLWRVANLIR